MEDRANRRAYRPLLQLLGRQDALSIRLEICAVHGSLRIVKQLATASVAPGRVSLKAS